MEKIAFYDAKSYDKVWFDELSAQYGIQLKYLESKLNSETAYMASGCRGVIAFVNDSVDRHTVEELYRLGAEVIAMRCAGYNNVDFQAAYGKLHVLRVPGYSPYSVAEHAMAMLLSLNRKLHRAYVRVRDQNFSLEGLVGFDLHGKTVGVVGTGRIGKTFLNICKGFGMKTVAYDPFPDPNLKAEYLSFPDLCRISDVISLHCPLTEDSYHLVDDKAFDHMKKGVILLNTSRGALVDSEALVEAVKSRKVGAAGLDVYEEESELFFEDRSGMVLQDDILSRLLMFPNVLVTSHQAFLTKEALRDIAETTLKNLRDYFDGNPLHNEICYQCTKGKPCGKEEGNRCF